MGPAAVIFDFFGTLTVSASRTSRSAGHEAVAAALGVPVEAYAAALLRSWPDRARGRLGDLASTTRAMARECGVPDLDDQALAAAVAARRSTQREFIALREDAVSTLRAIGEHGLAVGVVSDCTHELPEQWPELPIAPFVGTAVFSVVEGLKKPDPAIFRLACTRLGVAPADCLYVGDGDSNELPGAAAVGMAPVRLVTPDHDDGHRFDAVTWSGPETSSLSNVLDLL